MAKYSVFVHVKREKNLPSEITWIARRTADPAEEIGKGDEYHTGAGAGDAIQGGVYACIKHSEERGEPLALADLHVSISYETIKTKRNKVTGVQRRTEEFEANYAGIYAEIMKRPRPL